MKLTELVSQNIISRKDRSKTDTHTFMLLETGKRTTAIEKNK